MLRFLFNQPSFWSLSLPEQNSGDKWMSLYTVWKPFLLLNIKAVLKNWREWKQWLHTHTHTRLMALFLELPRWSGTRKVKPIWILVKQETVSDSGISWAICKSAPHSRQITTPAPHPKWRKVIKEVRWPGWVWAGECFFWYRPTRVVPDNNNNNNNDRLTAFDPGQPG